MLNESGILNQPQKPLEEADLEFESMDLRS